MKDVTSEMVKRVIALLRERGETLSVAESLTGGGLGAAITMIPGASEVLAGGVLTYTNAAKIAQVAVSEETLKTHGAVSEECAIEMATGVQALLSTTWAISTTGVAGPDPVDDLPVGTVWIAITGAGQVAGEVAAHTLELALSGDRHSIQIGTIASAIASFERILIS